MLGTSGHQGQLHREYSLGVGSKIFFDRKRVFQLYLVRFFSFVSSTLLKLQSYILKSRQDIDSLFFYVFKCPRNTRAN